MRKRRGISTKALVALLAFVLVIGCSLGGTLAWLTDKTDAVTNTFTVGDINITLTETKREYKILPGVNIPKDPKVTVLKDSEACWLFVKVDEANWPEFKEDDGTTRKVKYAIAADWTKLTGVEGVDNVYYRQVSAFTVDQSFPVLADNTVTVSDTLTKSEIAEVKKQGQPLLTFTAYAVQKEGVNTAAEAWKIANPATP